MYEMKPEYFTGVDFIDREHARLFELAQETYDLLQDTFQYKTDQITALVSELIDYNRTNFSHEEAYQKEINYPFIKQHAAQHRQFEDSLARIDLDSLSDDFDEQNETIENILNFLINWLVNHILKVDMLLVGKTVE